MNRSGFANATNNLAYPVGRRTLVANFAATKKAGLRFRNEIKLGPDGKQIQLEDPDGNPVELYEPASPTFEQVKLKQMEGTWSAIVQPASGPQSKGKMTVKLDLGGHWLVSHFKSDDGEFSGQRIDSYDPQSKRCYAVWADSLSTMPLPMSGNYEQNKLVMVGEFRGPDGKTQKMKFITEMVDKNHMTFMEYNLSSDGKEVAIMTITYERME